MSLTVVPPAGWDMPPITAPVAARPLSAVVEANVHHSDSPPPLTHDACPAVVRGFDDYHRHTNGWACIGYHRVICPHGVVFAGRSLSVVPAAALNHNTPIVAYCLIAKAGAANPKQWAGLLAIAARDAHRIGRPLRWTTHREVWPHTSCPGDAIQRQVDEQRRAHGPTTTTTAVAAAGFSRVTGLAVRQLLRALPRRKAPFTTAAVAELRRLQVELEHALERQ